MSPSQRKYIVSHDVGSAGDKAVLTDIQGKIIASCYAPYSMIYPAPGLSEQDPDMLWKTVVRTTKKLIRDTGVEPDEIHGMVKLVLGGIAAEGDMLAVEAIDRVGPGGNYLLDDHTLKYLRKERFSPPYRHDDQT